MSVASRVGGAEDQVVEREKHGAGTYRRRAPPVSGAQASAPKCHAMALMSRYQRTHDGQEQKTTTLELFYDLVFVFAITQVSHFLLEHLTWEGAGQAALVLLVVWWSWNYTTWVTNELDPESIVVRMLLIGLMLASFLMAVAIPEAFGDRALLFAGAYVAIQVGRHTFLTFVAAGPGTRGARARRADPDLVHRRRRAVDRRRAGRGPGAHDPLADRAGDRLRRAAVHVLRARDAQARRCRRGSSRPATSPSASSSS